MNIVAGWESFVFYIIWVNPTRRLSVVFEWAPSKLSLSHFFIVSPTPFDLYTLDPLSQNLFFSNFWIQNLTPYNILRSKFNLNSWNSTLTELSWVDNDFTPANPSKTKPLAWNIVTNTRCTVTNFSRRLIKEQPSVKITRKYPMYILHALSRYWLTSKT